MLGGGIISILLFVVDPTQTKDVFFGEGKSIIYSREKANNGDDNHHD